MSLVLDSSMTLAWYFEDEQTPAAMGVLREVAATGAVVPSLWRLEVANGLQAALKRKRITAAYRDVSLNDLGSLAISIDAETDRHAWTATLRLSDRFGLTMYDAAYLELSGRLGLPLATLDAQLASAAGASAIPLRGWA
jgi:predicted nucleic acid-binding protein